MFDCGLEVDWHANASEFGRKVEHLGADRRVAVCASCSEAKRWEGAWHADASVSDSENRHRGADWHVDARAFCAEVERRRAGRHVDGSASCAKGERRGGVRRGDVCASGSNVERRGAARSVDVGNAWCDSGRRIEAGSAPQQQTFCYKKVVVPRKIGREVATEAGFRACKAVKAIVSGGVRGLLAEQAGKVGIEFVFRGLE